MTTPTVVETHRNGATIHPVCPDCGRPIEQHPTGWWSHVGLPNGCWRASMDGPNGNSPLDKL